MDNLSFCLRSAFENSSGVIFILGFSECSFDGLPLGAENEFDSVMDGVFCNNTDDEASESGTIME